MQSKREERPNSRLIVTIDTQIKQRLNQVIDMTNAADLFDDLDRIDRIQQVPRVFREIRNPFEIFSERKFLKTFRFSKAGARNLINILTTILIRRRDLQGVSLEPGWHLALQCIIICNDYPRRVLP